MNALEKQAESRRTTIDAAELFKRLGLNLADPSPIVEGFRKANAEWRRQRQLRLEEHGQRIREHLARFEIRPPTSGRRPSRATMGRPRAVLCVELNQRFRTLIEAAEFVNRSPSNISQALRLGIRCGGYCWVDDGDRSHKNCGASWNDHPSKACVHDEKDR